MPKARKPTAAPRDLAGWAAHALAAQDLAPARHHLALLERLQAVADGRIDRLMVLMPPGSAKSTYASLVFPAWWLLHRGRSNVIAASHTAELAAHFGRRVRNMVAEHGADSTLARDSRAAHRFATAEGGEYFATGVQGPLSGRRADLALIDDPIKNQAQADSAAIRNGIWDWYRGDLLTRLKPGGRVVLIMTRWHEDDLGGRLLGSDGWTTLRLPAIAEEADPIGRTPGEALWPEWEDLPALLRRREAVGSRVWSALYQQSPGPSGGALFPADTVAVVDEVPAGLTVVRAWDLAASVPEAGRDPDWTVGLKLGRDRQGNHYVLDVVRLRAGPNEVARTIAAVASRDGRGVAIGLPQDPGQAGKTQVAWLTGLMPGYRIKAGPESGSKTLRATPAAAAVEAGRLMLLRGRWNAALVEELREFPHGAKDDQVDALSRAFGMLAAPVARRFTLPVIGR